MGIGPATIKSKSELVQPSKRIGYLYNVEPSGLFPKEQAHSSKAAGRLGVTCVPSICLTQSCARPVAKNCGNRAGEAPLFCHHAAREAASRRPAAAPRIQTPGGTKMKMLVTAASLAGLMTVPAMAQDAVQHAQEAPVVEAVEKKSAATFSGDVSAKELLSENVVNAANESIGDINDVLIGHDGRVAAVIVGVGGFLGMGEKDVALPYDQLTFSKDGNNNLIVGTSATKESLETAPEYSRSGDRS